MWSALLAALSQTFGDADRDDDAPAEQQQEQRRPAYWSAEDDRSERAGRAEGCPSGGGSDDGTRAPQISAVAVLFQVTDSDERASDSKRERRRDEDGAERAAAPRDRKGDACRELSPEQQRLFLAWKPTTIESVIDQEWGRANFGRPMIVDGTIGDEWTRSFGCMCVASARLKSPRDVTEIEYHAVYAFDPGVPPVPGRGGASAECLEKTGCKPVYGLRIVRADKIEFTRAIICGRYEDDGGCCWARVLSWDRGEREGAPVDARDMMAGLVLLQYNEVQVTDVPWQDVAAEANPRLAEALRNMMREPR